MPPTKKGKKKKRKTRKKQKGGTKNIFTDENLVQFIDAVTDREDFLYYFYYSDVKIDNIVSAKINNDGYAKFQGLAESSKMERQDYIAELIAALQKYQAKATATAAATAVPATAAPATAATAAIEHAHVENIIHILQMLNKISMWERFRSIFIPDNTVSYSDPRESYLKETDIIMTTLPNPLGFAIDPSSNVLQNTQLEILEKFPGGPLDRMLHAFYNVENDLYLKMLLGDGNGKEKKKMMERIMKANEKSQKDTFTFANSNPIIKKT